MMNKIRIDMDNAAQAEMERAITDHGYYANLREAHSIIQEEVEEMEEQIVNTSSAFSEFWRSVRTNDRAHAMESACHLYKEAREAACECVQVMAVCKKMWQIPEEGE